MTPLQINNVTVHKVAPGGEFDLTNWAVISGLVETYLVQATGTAFSNSPWLTANTPPSSSPYGGTTTANGGNNE